MTTLISLSLSFKASDCKPRIISPLHRHIEKNTTVVSNKKAANKGDALACEVIEQVGRHLGKTIAIAINLFNPQKVVIAGEIVEAEKVLLPAIEGCINTQALKAFRQNLPVVRSKLDHRSAIGAFALVKRAMLNGILLQHLLES